MNSMQDYELQPSQDAKEGQRKQFWPQFLGGAVVALALVIGALYGPMLWQSGTANATPSLQSSNVVPTVNRLANPAISLFNDQEALADLYEQLTPSVVNIQVTVKARTSIFGLPDEDAPSTGGQGSGFIYDDLGHIVTNHHVVEDAETVLVMFHNGFWADAEVVATDPQADLAVIKVEPPADLDWRPLPIADPETLRVGHMVIAIGNPFGLEGTMTTGVVSAMGRGMPVGNLGSARYTLPDIIQTDAAINPGNSGGPLINLAGEVVGVNFAIESAVRSNSGVGFTIPVSILRRVVPDLIAKGGFEYPYLGVSGNTISPGLAEALDLPENQLGIYVQTVVRGGPSADSGLKGGNRTVRNDNGVDMQAGGDIITAINGETVRSFEDLVGYLVTETEPGQTITLSILRKGDAMDVDVTLGKRPNSSGGFSAPEPREVNARRAIAIASKFVTDENALDGKIEEKTAVPDTMDGIDVWVVELSSGDQLIEVIVAKADGEVLSYEEK